MEKTPKNIKADESGTCIAEVASTHRRAEAVVGKVHILAVNLSRLFVNILLKSTAVTRAYTSTQDCRAFIADRFFSSSYL